MSTIFAIVLFKIVFLLFGDVPTFALWVWSVSTFHMLLFLFIFMCSFRFLLAPPFEPFSFAFFLLNF